MLRSKATPGNKLGRHGRELRELNFSDLVRFDYHPDSWRGVLPRVHQGRITLTSDQTIDGKGSGFSWARVIPVVLICACAISLSVDIPVASVFALKKVPKAIDGPLREYLEICESFGHGFGAFLIVMAVRALDPNRRRTVPWLIAGSIGAGIVANLFKLVVRRTRPRDFDFTNGSVWHTYTSDAGSTITMHSFPSAHTATAVGLAVVLSELYPRGRVYFFILACLAGLQRIVSSAHFPSDVLAGAAVGAIVGSLCAKAIRRSESAS